MAPSLIQPHSIPSSKVRAVIQGRSPHAMLNGVKHGFFSNEVRVGRCANIAVTATVANSAIQGFIEALGVFIDAGLPLPREVFSRPLSSSALTLVWPPLCPLRSKLREANIVFAIGQDHKIWCMKSQVGPQFEANP